MTTALVLGIAVLYLLGMTDPRLYPDLNEAISSVMLTLLSTSAFSVVLALVIPGDLLPKIRRTPSAADRDRIGDPGLDSRFAAVVHSGLPRT